MASEQNSTTIKIGQGLTLLRDLKQRPLQTIHHWQNYRVTWLIMFASALFLELCALGFQYIMHMDPCELCVYQRLAVLMLIVSPVVMMISPANPVLRIAGYGLWIAAALYGLDNAITQTADYAEFNPFTSSCSFRPSFPFDLPLYEWLPSLFMPTGICGADNWTFLTLNMAQWMVIVFAIYLMTAAVCSISSVYCTLIKKSIKKS